MNQRELLDLVRHEIDDWNQVALIKGVGAAGLGIASGIAYLLNPPARQYLVSGIGLTANRVLAGVFVLALLTVGAVLLRRYVTSASARWPTVAALRDDPRRVVWVYHSEVHRSGAHSKTEIWVGLSDGTLEGFMSSRGRDTQILAGLQEVCPHAVHGYSEDLAARFRRDPRSLLAV